MFLSKDDKLDDTINTQKNLITEWKQNKVEIKTLQTRNGVIEGQIDQNYKTITQEINMMVA